MGKSFNESGFHFFQSVERVIFPNWNNFAPWKMPVRHFCLIAMCVRAKYSQFGSVPSPLVFLFCLHEETKTTMRHLLLGGNKNINFCSTCMFDVCSAHISYDWIRILTNNFTEFYSETSYLAQNHSHRNDLLEEREYLKEPMRTQIQSGGKHGWLIRV